MAKCEAVTKSGFPCTAPAVEGSDRCIFHSEAVSDEARREIWARGGANGRRSKWIEGGGKIGLDIESILALLEEALLNARELINSPAAVNSVTAIARELKDLYELAGMTDQLARVEELLASYRGENGK